VSVCKGHGNNDGDNNGQQQQQQQQPVLLVEAETLFRRALELTPHDTDAMYNLGGCLKALGKVRESIEVKTKDTRIPR
jgi:hypothetical protein